MKITSKITVLAAAVLAAPATFAQSSVTIFGLTDVGVTYVSNEGGHSNLKTDDSIYYPNLLGFAGREDLGGGTHAIFKLVGQYSLLNGQLVGGGLFARNAFVGLEDDHYGTLTLGNQYEFMVDALTNGGASAELAQDLAGLYGFRNGPFNKLGIPGNPTGAFDWDRTAGSTRVANSVKYVSPTVSGFRIGVLYGFGNVAGSIGSNNTTSVGLTYNAGPLGAGAAYTNTKYDGGISIRNWGAGMHYTFGTVTAKALLTTVHNSANGAGIWMTEAGADWLLAPQWNTGLSYTYMKGNAQLNQVHAHQISAAVDYLLSKRTVLYVSAVYQKASAGANAQINGVLDADGASSGSSQALARIGLAHAF